MKLALFSLVAVLAFGPMLAEAGHQQKRAPGSKQPVRNGARPSASKNGAHQAKKSGAHQIGSRNGAHQAPKNGSKPAVAPKEKTTEVTPVP